MVALKAGIVLAGRVGDRRGEMHGRRVLLSLVIADGHTSDVLPGVTE